MMRSLGVSAALLSLATPSAALRRSKSEDENLPIYRGLNDAECGYGLPQYWPPQVASCDTWWRADDNAITLKGKIEERGPPWQEVQFRPSLNLGENTYLEYLSPVEQLMVIKELKKPCRLHITLYFGKTRKPPETKKALKTSSTTPSGRKRSTQRWEQIVLANTRKKVDLQWSQIPEHLRADMREAMIKEFRSWQKNEAFRVVKRSHVPRGTQVLRSRCIKRVKDLLQGGRADRAEVQGEAHRPRV